MQFFRDNNNNTCDSQTTQRCIRIGRLSAHKDIWFSINSHKLSVFYLPNLTLPTYLMHECENEYIFQSRYLKHGFFITNSVTRCWIKKKPNFHQILLRKYPKQFVFIKWRFLNSQKVPKHLGYCERLFVTKNFQKSPNLVTLITNNDYFCRVIVIALHLNVICF